jgi:uncharacterized membrane protein
MELYYLLKLALTLHIIGLTIAGGISIANYLSYRRFWREYVFNKSKAFAVLEGIMKYPRIIAIGLILSVISGITMMNLAFSAFMYEAWFHVKLSLIIIVILNTVLIYRFTKRIRKNLISKDDEIILQQKVGMLRKKVQISVLFQLALFFLIFVIAVFRFNY